MIDTVRRLGGWLWISTVALLLIGYLAPQQVGVLLFKILQITLGVCLGYTADRELFKYVTPIDKVDADAFGAARLLARAIVVVGVLLALSLGL
jgi:hypothetical protein